MTENSTTPITGNENSFLDISMNGGFFGLIELGVMVVVMLIIAISKIISQCKKSKTSDEKIKILQETFDLKAIEKLGVVMKQDKSAVPTDTLATIVHTAAQSVANTIQDTTTKQPPQNVVIDKTVLEEAIQKSVQNMIASQKQTVVQLDKSGKASTEVIVQTNKGEIPIKLSVSKEKTGEVAIEMPDE